MRIGLAALAIGAVLASGLAAVPAAAEERPVAAEKRPVAAEERKKRDFPKASKPVKGKVCPARKFWIGSGWGDKRWHGRHRGIDLGGRRGSPIYAVEGGRIYQAERQDNKALMIVLKGRSGSAYYYGHMDRLFVRKGERVRRGEVIGTMGDTGSRGAVHLHFEYWKSGRYSDAINPERFVRRICRR